MPYLFIDFGASRIKTAIFTNGQYIQIQNFTPVAKELRASHYYEISLQKIQDLFQEILNTYHNFSIKKFFICSEMHGFALCDCNNNFLTNYISWQDNRAADVVGNISTYEWARKRLPTFREKTGMNIKNGLPAINLLHLLRTQDLPKKIKIISLPEIIIGSKIHNTLLAGLGIWDIYQNQPYEEFFRLCNELGYEITTNMPTSAIEIVGSIHNISIYTPVGDNQCALLGSGVKKNDVIFNLGTGSQVAQISELDPYASIEQRPYFNNENLSIITHIPSGRVLNQFIGFIQECINIGNSYKNAWDLFQTLNLGSLETATLDINLAIFEGAYKRERERERERESKHFKYKRIFFYSAKLLQFFTKMLH
ncbi:FGGY family of carbohydrate kinases, N-terminal domain [Brevinema andersonii]|uniref:FGGY family of carbohydrate kinases, N-terminal domain n=1 Tax=Brevinema andersonii TaxID=34097 RepID=A0A1I1EDT2_BREAD|nr:FGGY family carbohydrate kinase [Brevinema andersonii]SFB85275.1 FGGY family of carbohydrate kinases, N-terminal domain [Brevinema andersonii]